MLNSFLKDSLIYAVPSLVSRGMSLLLLPLYTRVLSPADYGSFDLLIIFAAFINLTIALEVSQGVARFFSAERDQQKKIGYASSAFWFTLICYSIFLAIALFYADFLAEIVLGQRGLESSFRIGVLYIWINGLFYLVQNQLRWELRSVNYAIISLLMTFVTAGASFYFAYILKFGIEGLLIGMFLGSLSGTILGLYWLRESFSSRLIPSLLREMITYSTPLVFSGVAIWVNLYIDRIMINHFLSIDDLGLYAIGFRIASIAGLAIIGIQDALTPLIFKNFQKEETPHQLAKLFRYFVVFALFIFLSLSLFTDDLLKLLTTESFYGGGIVVAYLVPAILLGNMYIFAPGISIAKKTKFIAYINVTGAALNIILNYFLIPKFGIVGAGTATLLTKLIIFIMYMTLSQKFYPVPHRWKAIIMLTISAFIVAIFMSDLQIKDLHRLFINIIVILSFFLIALITKIISQEEVEQAYQLFKRRLRQLSAGSNS